MSRHVPKVMLPLLFFVCSLPTANATFIINYADGAGVGYNDPTYGPARRAAFEWAVNRWDLWLGGTDPVPIRVESRWASQGPGVLGSSSSSYYIWRNASQFPFQNTWYGDSLADYLYGSDLGGGHWDFRLTFNLDFTNWNYDYTLPDGAFSGLYDFATVSMHEIGHGMGLFGSFASDGSWGYLGDPFVYDRFLEYQNGTDLIATQPAPDVTKNPGGGGAADNGIFWSGANATAANGGSRAEIYAPATWAGGSSLVHLDHTAHPSLLMNYSLMPNDERRTIDPLMQGMLWDLGWDGDVRFIPEPGTLVLLGVGLLLGLLLERRRRA